MANGFIKLHRKLLDNEIILKPQYLQLFIYCLLKANWTESVVDWGSEKMIVGAGQFITSRFTIARDLQCKPSTANYRINYLKNVQLIDIKTNNKKTLVTIVNWAVYQSDTKEADNKTDNRTDSKLTAELTAELTQIKNLKEFKESKKDSKDLKQCPEKIQGVDDFFKKDKNQDQNKKPKKPIKVKPLIIDTLTEAELSKFMEFVDMHKNIYQENKGTDHPEILKEKLNNIYLNVTEFNNDNEIEFADHAELIQNFFDRVKESNHNICHYATYGIMENCYHQVYGTYSQSEAQDL